MFLLKSKVLNIMFGVPADLKSPPLGVPADLKSAVKKGSTY